MLAVLSLVLGVQQIGIADNGGQRRAQFVGHVGDEVALQPHRFIERLVALFDRLFELSGRRDVGKGDQGRAVRQGLGAPLRQPAVGDADFTQLRRARQRIGIGHPRLEL